MLSDRPYMRDDYQRERTSFLVWLLSATIAGFIIQKISLGWLNTVGFEQMMALSAAALRHGNFWTLLTYPLVHRNALHLLVVVLSLFFIGRELTPHVGERRLFWLTIAATVAGGLMWFAVNFAHPGDVMGATSILCCYLALFACLFPNREISFLVFFVIPITTRPKYIAWLVVGLDACGLILSELVGGRLRTGVPHSAHLGAMLTAWVYFRYVHGNEFNFRRGAEIELPRWMKRGKKAAPAPAYQVNVSPPPREDIRAEVDRILDKINSHGFGALTPEEKRVLDNARDLLSRR